MYVVTPLTALLEHAGERVPVSSSKGVLGLRKVPEGVATRKVSAPTFVPMKLFPHTQSLDLQPTRANTAKI